jgi:hypothetical protein
METIFQGPGKSNFDFWKSLWPLSSSVLDGTFYLQASRSRTGVKKEGP